MSDEDIVKEVVDDRRIDLGEGVSFESPIGIIYGEIKVERDKLVCRICGKIYKNLKCLSGHIRSIHKNEITLKKYYDDYLKKDINKSICPTCKKESKFLGLGGYQKFCSRKCMSNNKEIREQMKQTSLKNNGVDNIFKDVEYIKKCTFKKYGVNSTNQLKWVQDKSEQTNLRKRGVKSSNKSPEVKEKMKNSMLKNLGVEHALQSKICREKYKYTCRKKYQKDYWHQTEEGIEFHKKQILVQAADQRNHGEPVFPSVGKKERPFFDKCELKLGIKFIRQDCIFGFWPDGRPEPFWIRLLVQYDEKAHYNSQGILSDYDVKKQAKLAAKGFILYHVKESDCDINEDLEIEKLGNFIEMLKEEYNNNQLI